MERVNERPNETICVNVGVLLTFEPLRFLERYHEDGWVHEGAWQRQGYVSLYCDSNC